MRIKLFTKHEHFQRLLSGHTLVERIEDADLLISYDWPKKIDLLGKRGINLHNAYLPYNRGTDANIWSWLTGTPKGVTIHWMDEGIDTGPILAQERLDEAFLKKMDLRTSYEYIHFRLEKLFEDNFPQMLEWKPTPQDHGRATVHRKKQAREIFDWLAARGFRVLPEELIRVWGKKIPVIQA